jgi:23S rRNA pseudouridine2605 synthase
LEKRVLVNGRIATLGIKVDPKNDEIEIDFEPLKVKPKQIKVIAFNKPIDIISSMQGEYSLKQFVEKFSDRFFHIGRLDKDSHGLILFTNNGNVAQKISHPSNKISKKYIVQIDSILNSSIIEKLKKGFRLKDKTYDFVKFDNIKTIDSTLKKSIVEISLHSGKNRIIKRAFEVFNIKVLDLERTQIGNIKLGELKNGSTRVLSKNETKSLLKYNNK